MVIACLVAAGHPGGAQAGICFTSASDWLVAADGPLYVETFNSSTPGPLPLGTTPLDVVTVDLVGAAVGSTRIANPATEPLFMFPTQYFAGAIGIAPGNVTEITFTFPRQTTAWGADFLSAATGDILTVTIGNDGPTYNLKDELGGMGNGFFGTVEPEGFTSITFRTVAHTPYGEFFSMDNLQSVPEPGTIWLALSGAACLTLAAWIRRRL